jgi:hypothetical protein
MWHKIDKIHRIRLFANTLCHLKIISLSDHSILHSEYMRNLRNDIKRRENRVLIGLTTFAFIMFVTGLIDVLTN